MNFSYISIGEGNGETKSPAKKRPEKDAEKNLAEKNQRCPWL